MPFSGSGQGKSISGPPMGSAGLDAAEEQYRLAVGLYERGEWALAAREFQTFLRQYPQHGQAHRANFLLAETLLQLGQYEDAQARFTEYLRQEPQGLWAAKALFRSGEAAFLAGKTEQAAKLLKDFLGQYPTEPMAAYALVYLGQLSRKGNHWSAAREYFQQALDRFPQSPVRAESQLGLAQSLEALGEAEQALRLYQAVGQEDSGPVGAEAQFRLAALLYNLHRYPEAVAAFQVYQHRYPTTGQAAYARLYQGFALFHLKRWEEARSCFSWLAGMGAGQGASGSSRQEPRGLAGAGLPLGEAGRSAGSGSYPSSARLPAKELEQLRRQGEYWLGMIEREQGQWVESANRFSQLAQTATEPSERIECHFYAADGWLRARDLKAALKQFDLALAALAQNSAGEQIPSAKSPPLGDAAQAAESSGPQQGCPWLDKILQGKLQAAVLLQDHPLADQTAKQFAQRCPQSPLAAEVARWQAQSLLQRKQYQEAIPILEPWPEKTSDKELACHIRYLLAYAYQATGRFQQAQAQLAPLLQADKGQWKSLAQLAQASLLMAQKQYDKAAPLLEAYVNSDASQPEQITAQAQLALCYGWLGQTEKAQKVYKELASKHSTAAWFGSWSEQLAQAALQAGDFAWARSLFEQLTHQADQAAVQRALLGLAWTQYRAGEFPEASATLARLLAMEQLPAWLDAEAAFLRATTLAKLRQPDAALALLERVVEKYPETKWFGSALLAAGRLEAQLGQHAQAAQRFQRYVETFPNASDLDAALYDWAWSLHDSGKPEEAAKLFERIHRDFPKSPYWAEVTLRLAQQAYQTQQYERAGQLTAAVLGNCPADLRPYGLYLQMQIAAAQGQWDTVGQLAQQLLLQHPGSPLQVYAEFWQAEVAFRKKDFHSASKLLEQFGKKYPSPPTALAPLAALRHAQLLAHQRQWDEVIQAANRIRQQYPQFEQIYEADYLLGRALAMKARFDEAREAFYRVIRSAQGAKTETAAMAQWYIGETYFHQRDYQTALRAYLLVDILYTYPEWQALALLEAARCHQMLGQPDQAQKLYQRLLEQFPNTAAAQQYRTGRQSGSADPASPPTGPASVPSDQLPSTSPVLPQQKTSQLPPLRSVGESQGGHVGAVNIFSYLAASWPSPPAEIRRGEKRILKNMFIFPLKSFTRFPLLG